MARLSSANGMFLADSEIVLYSFQLARWSRQPPGAPGATWHRALLLVQLPQATITLGSPHRRREPDPVCFASRRITCFSQAGPSKPSHHPQHNAGHTPRKHRDDALPAGKTRKYAGHTACEAWHNVIEEQAQTSFPIKANPEKSGGAKPWICTGSGGPATWPPCPDDGQAAEASLSNRVYPEKRMAVAAWFVFWVGEYALTSPQPDIPGNRRGLCAAASCDEPKPASTSG